MSERKRIVVTGLGIVCGLGNDVDTCWQKLTAGVSAIQEVRSVDTANCYAHKGAEVDLQFAADTLDRSSLLCIQAAEEAVADASIPDDKKNIGVIIGSCVGGAASIDKYYSDIKNTGKCEKSDIYKMPASAIANNVSAHFGLDGVTANIVNACAAGTISIAYACDLIRAGKGDCFLAGGTDSFSSLAFSGFHALKALDADACSPFNRSSGISLGEGAGVLVVEDYDHAVKRGAKIYCEILGSGVSSDAYHITAPRPDGKGQMSAISRAMENAGVSTNEIDYINAHGTGTAKNDEAEFLSLHTLFDGNPDLSVSSTKSMTGHCLGAAGSIEAVFSVKALCENTVPPTIGYSDADLEKLAQKAGALDFVANQSREKEMQTVMSNSFAFGGTNASIIFSKQQKEPAAVPARKKIVITGIGKQFTIDNADFKEQNIKMAFYRKLDRFSKLQLLSGVKALRDAQINMDGQNADAVGIVIGTADGPMKEIADFQKNVVENGVEKGSAFAFPNTVYNAAGGYLSIFTGAMGYNATIANSVQAGLQSLCFASDVIESGAANVILAAGTDENSDIETSLYETLGVLGDGMPYQGNGIRLGEGSVTLVLESAESAQKRGATVLAELAGTATAHHAVESNTVVGSEQALRDVIKKACQDAGLSLGEIDAVCGFANGSPVIDDLEIKTYRELFATIPVFSVKEKYGEARAAAAMLQAAFAAELLSGSAESVTCCQISANGTVPTKVQATEMKNILAVSFGLGGSYSAVIIRRAEESDGNVRQ